MAVKQNKLGPCGTPGNPPCDAEYIDLIQGSRLPDSYKKELIADAEKYLKSVTKDGEPLTRITPRHLNESGRALTKKRLEALKATNAYKKLIANPNAGPIFKAMSSALKKVDTGVYRPDEYALPALSEIPELIKLGDKYADFDKNTKISFVDKAKGGYLGVQLLNRYPNLQKYIPKIRNKEGKMVRMNIPLLKKNPRYY
tara:strand:+ start:518 stop:1114 length:597 start_codon:yes stop_codon:yes gene_type:complete